MSEADEPAPPPKKVTGSLNVVLGPATIAAAAPPNTYFGVARGMMPSVRILAAANPTGSAFGLTLIAAHTLECLLKAYLSRSGSDVGLRNPNVRHNLVALWLKAAADGLAVTMPLPLWAQGLSRLHDTPYYLRYSTGVHGIVFPPLAATATELEKIFTLVQSKLY